MIRPTAGKGGESHIGTGGSGVAGEGRVGKGDVKDQRRAVAKSAVDAVELDGVVDGAQVNDAGSVPGLAKTLGGIEHKDGDGSQDGDNADDDDKLKDSEAFGELRGFHKFNYFLKTTNL